MSIIGRAFIFVLPFYLLIAALPFFAVFGLTKKTPRRHLHHEENETSLMVEWIAVACAGFAACTPMTLIILREVIPYSDIMPAIGIFSGFVCAGLAGRFARKRKGLRFAVALMGVFLGALGPAILLVRGMHHA